jgi:hypothetical protein
VTQIFQFTLPWNKIKFSVTGIGCAYIKIKKIFMEQEQKRIKTVPFELTKEFTSMPWLIEIKATTFMPYRPTTKDKRLNKEYSNRTMIIQVELPSGKRSYFILKKSCGTKPSNSLLGA